MMDVVDAEALTLGAKVRYTTHLRRAYRDGLRVWLSEPTVIRDAWRSRHEIRKGIVVGKRKLANGRSEWDDYSHTFHVEEYVDAYLVAWNMRRKPDLVLAEDLEFDDE